MYPDYLVHFNKNHSPISRDFVERQNQIKWREAASQAKFAGGDW